MIWCYTNKVELNWKQIFSPSLFKAALQCKVIMWMWHIQMKHLQTWWLLLCICMPKVNLNNKAYISWLSGEKNFKQWIWSSENNLCNWMNESMSVIIKNTWDVTLIPCVCCLHAHNINNVNYVTLMLRMS